MGLLDKIKEGAQQQGGNKGLLFYVKSGEKKRIRILQEVDDGFEVELLSNFKKGITVVATEDALERYGDDEGFKVKKLYAFAIWDYEAEEQRIMLYGASNFTPLPQLISYYEENGTWCDRDFVIKCQGEKLKKSYTVMAQDKSKTKNKEKAWSEKKMWSIIKKAYVDDNADIDEEDDEDEEDVKPKKGKGGKNKVEKEEPKKKGKKKAPEPEPEEDEEDEWEEEDYGEMTAKELYALCKKRGLEAAPKKKEQYYIDILEADDSDEDGEDEEDDDEEW